MGPNGTDAIFEFLTLIAILTFIYFMSRDT